MKNNLDLEAILKKVQELTPDYWKDRFRAYDIKRLQKNKDMESIILFLLDECLEDIYDFIYSFYGKYSVDGIVPDEVARIQLNSKELLILIEYLNSLLELAGSEDIKFDSDIENTIKKLSTTTKLSRIEGLILKIKARIEYCYGKIEKRMTSHLSDIIEDAYWSSVYEVFNAVGYGNKYVYSLNVYEDDENTLIPFVLIYGWRSTLEGYDDTIWRYKREMEYNLERELKRSGFTNSQVIPLVEKVSSYFKRDNKNLKAMINTDSTFYSTHAQTEAFDDLQVQEALYCTIDDERRSEICTELDGSVIPVQDIEPWVNAPPMHYNCRSWLTPIIDNVEYLDDDEIYEMGDMDFDTWYDTWV